MSTNAGKCPVCQQVLPDPSAVARMKHNLAKFNAKHEAELERKLEAERKRAERVAEAKVRNEYERRMKDAREAAASKARSEERKKNERANDQLQRKVEELSRKLEKATADERGETGEADVRRSLQDAFPTDIIERLGKGRGSADIRHEVRENGRTCGVIVYEIKNVTKWSGEYVKQAKKSLRMHQASQTVLVSTAFPSAQKYLTFHGDVAVVHPTIVANVVKALRQVIVLRAVPTTTRADQSRKAEQLLQFAKGEEFRRSMRAIAESTAELHRLQTKERQQHDRIWTAQTDLFRSVEQGHASIETRITQIVSGVPLALVDEETAVEEKAEAV